MLEWDKRKTKSWSIKDELTPNINSEVWFIPKKANYPAISFITASLLLIERTWKKQIDKQNFPKILLKNVINFYFKEETTKEGNQVLENGPLQVTASIKTISSQDLFSQCLGC